MYEKLIQALKMAEEMEKSGLPAVGMADFDMARRPYGTRGGMSQAVTTWTAFKEKLSTLKEASLTPEHVLLYGCTGLFSLCGPDEVIGLSMADDKLISWLDWRENSVCEQFIKFVTYMDMAGTAAGAPVSTAGQACDDPPLTEYGTFEFFLGDKGLLRVSGDPIPLDKIGERKCDKQPIYTLPVPGSGNPGGLRIDNDLDWQAIVAGQALKNDLSRKAITGDRTNTGEFDGLQELVNTGYVDIRTGTTNKAVDSFVLNWASDNLDGAVNGRGNIIGLVIAVVRRLKQRIQMSGRGAVAAGDMVLVMRTELRDCFLDAFACYGLCAPSQFNELFRDNLATREFRDRFNSGLYGDGYITVDGIPIPIITHDWLPLSQSGVNHTSDIYILTRRIGSTPVLYGQYHPMSQAVEVARSLGADHYRLMQGNRMIQWVKWDNICVQMSLGIKPNIYLSAPWAQARITNVGCNAPLDPISLDPQSTYFVADKRVANPMPQYFYKDGVWVQNFATPYVAG